MFQVIRASVDKVLCFLRKNVVEFTGVHLKTTQALFSHLLFATQMVNLAHSFVVSSPVNASMCKAILLSDVLISTYENFNVREDWKFFWDDDIVAEGWKYGFVTILSTLCLFFKAFEGSDSYLETHCALFCTVTVGLRLFMMFFCFKSAFTSFTKAPSLPPVETLIVQPIAVKSLVEKYSFTLTLRFAAIMCILESGQRWFDNQPERLMAVYCQIVLSVYNIVILVVVYPKVSLLGVQDSNLKLSLLCNICYILSFGMAFHIFSNTQMYKLF